MHNHLVNSAISFLLLSNLLYHPVVVSSKAPTTTLSSLLNSSHLPRLPGRGGATTTTTTKQTTTNDKTDAFQLLGTAIQSSLHKTILASSTTTTSTASTQPPPASLKSITQSLALLAKSQSTLKSIDGASHEFYQRSHSNSLETSTTAEVNGRAARSASRTGCCADALFACELLDLLIDPPSPPPPPTVEGDDDDTSISTDDTEERTMEQTTLELAGGREILLNITLANNNAAIPLQVLVLHETEYVGGGGENHGGIDGLLVSSSSSSSSPNSSSAQRPRGRILIIVRDVHETDLRQTLNQLDHAPVFIDLEEGLMAQEVACVNDILWRCAEELLVALEPILTMNGGNDAGEGSATQGGDGGDDDGCDDKREMTSLPLPPAIHFVARSLAGGVVSLAAAMLNGNIPMPPPVVAVARRKRKGHTDPHRKKVRRRPHDDPKTGSPSSPSGKSKTRRTKHKGEDQRNDDDTDGTVTSSNEFVPKGNDDQGKSKRSTTLSLHGFAKGRTSAVVIGAPPSLSSNVEVPFITSVIHGDDVVCRATKDSLDTLRKRTIRTLKKNSLTKRVGWMADTINLAVSGIQTHAHGSEGEEARLSLAGRVYLVRPRRISGGVSSMHEIGAAGGREALRAAVLWSLRDILLSKSLWAHHSLEAYIVGLDKVQLRKFRAEDE